MTEPQPTWKALAPTPTQKFVQPQGLVDGYDVGFITDTGLNGVVFVPKAQAGNLPLVRAAIEAEVQRLHDIHNLTG